MTTSKQNSSEEHLDAVTEIRGKKRVCAVRQYLVAQGRFQNILNWGDTGWGWGPITKHLIRNKYNAKNWKAVGFILSICFAK